MKFRIPAVFALFAFLALTPSVNAQGQMSSPAYHGRLAPVHAAYRVPAAPAAAPVPAAAPAFPYPDQNPEQTTATDNSDDETALLQNQSQDDATQPCMEQCYETQTNAWQDKVYYDAQERAPKIKGILRAPEQKLYSQDHKVLGTATCYKGNTAQWLKGRSAPLQRSLPQTQNGLNAINGGYTGAAATLGMSGGFTGGGLSRVYPDLPQTATSVIVELNVAQ